MLRFKKHGKTGYRNSSENYYRNRRLGSFFRNRFEPLSHHRNIFATSETQITAVFAGNGATEAEVGDLRPSISLYFRNSFWRDLSSRTQRKDRNSGVAIDFAGRPHLCCYRRSERQRAYANTFLFITIHFTVHMTLLSPMTRQVYALFFAVLPLLLLPSPPPPRIRSKYLPPQSTNHVACM